MRGAIREDDYMFGPNPWFVDPDSPLTNRPLNHFYDPQFDSPLRIVIDLGAKSPAWGVGTRQPFTKPIIPDAGRDNHYAVFDAREAMYRALTGKKFDGSNEPTAATKAGRDKYWATTFRALGNIVHLVQDMSQPQHTRNDPHAGSQFDGTRGPLGHMSAYEAYIEASATGASFRTTSDTSTVNPLTVTPVSWSELLGDGSYPRPRFTDYVSFWTTRHLGEALGARRGLADYSNRGFFSAGTNLGSPYVSAYPATTGVAQVPYNWNGQPVSDPTMSVLTGTVTDSLPGGQNAEGVYLTTEGVWDQFLQENNHPRGFTLTRVNYDDQAKLLIPRAVAYSAGLVDYFFRGRLEAEDADFTDAGVRLKVRNAIDKQKFPAWANESMTSGASLVLAYEYQDADGTKHVGSSSAVTLTETLAPGQVSRQAYEFTLSIPDGAKKTKYRLVYRGRLGEEQDALAVGEVRPASGFLVKPSYLPADGIAGARMIYRQRGQWKLSGAEGMKAGVIDWKGWYQDGKPTKVLSWAEAEGGFLPRYTTAPYGSIASNSGVIYQNGEIFAIAPGTALLGAALNRTGAEESIIVVVTDGRSDVVYKRPNRKSTSAAYYDSIARPDGWKETGRYTHPVGMYWGANAWYFNGEGTEAQTMRLIDAQGRLDRLKVTISAEVASFANLGNLDGIEITQTRTVPWPLPPCPVTQYVDNVEVAQSGRYYVAVDYRDNREVLAEVVASGTGRYTASYSRTCSNSSPNWTISSSYSADLQRVLVYGSGSVELDRRVHSYSSQSSWRHYPNSDGLKAAQDQLTSQRSSLEQLTFLDLRHDLSAGVAASRSTTRTETFTAQDDLGRGEYCAESTASARFDRTVKFGSQNIPVKQDTQDPGDGTACWPASLFVGGSSSSPQYALGYLAPLPSKQYPGLGVLASHGSWVVDKDANLVFSQEAPAFDNPLPTDFFNYLSDGGDLRALIPSASGEVSYFPIQLIK